MEVIRVTLNLRVSPHRLCLDIEHAVRQEAFQTEFPALPTREPGALIQQGLAQQIPAEQRNVFATGPFCPRA